MYFFTYSCGASVENGLLWRCASQSSLLYGGFRITFATLQIIFTFPLWAFKWTFTFEMWFIPSWTNRFKPHPHTRHLSGLASSPSNDVACLLTFAWRWTRNVMTLSAEIRRFGYSKPYVMSDLIQNILKTSQVRWKLKTDTWLII